MNTKQVNINVGPGMSNTTFHKRCNSEGQRYWWLRGPDGFVNIPARRGDRALDLEIDLAPGEYTLGTGPRKQGERLALTVSANGEVEIH